jgi:hypothetical protein
MKGKRPCAVLCRGTRLPSFSSSPALSAAATNGQHQVVSTYITLATSDEFILQLHQLHAWPRQLGPRHAASGAAVQCSARMRGLSRGPDTSTAGPGSPQHILRC